MWQYNMIRCLNISGVGTDGEFHTLRTRGDSRALHLYQVIHDVKEGVKRMSVNTLRNLLYPGYGKFL